MRRIYLGVIIGVFIMSIIINLIFGDDRIWPLVAAVGILWMNVSDLKQFMDFDKPYTCIAIVNTVLADENINVRKKWFHTDLLVHSFLSLLIAFK